MNRGDQADQGLRNLFPRQDPGEKRGRGDDEHDARGAGRGLLQNPGKIVQGQFFVDEEADEQGIDHGHRR